MTVDMHDRKKKMIIFDPQNFFCKLTKRLKFLFSLHVHIREH